MKPKYTFRGATVRTDPAHARSGLSRIRSDAARAKGAAAGPARVRVSREVAGRAGKGVSVISGLPLAADELDALASRLKRLCGAGGAVREGRIEIQGDHRDRLVEELSRLGYDAKRSGG